MQSIKLITAVLLYLIAWSGPSLCLWFSDTTPMILQCLGCTVVFFGGTFFGGTLLEQVTKGSI
jgi:hypothetical protein